MKSGLTGNHTAGMNGFKTIFRSLRYRNYRLFFAGQSISLVGTWIQRIAVPWLVYRLTGSVLLLGVVSFASQIPTFLFTPFAGVISDKWNRHRILIVTQILAMLQSLVLTILFFSERMQIWHIILLSVLLGCVNAFDMPTRQSFLVDLIEKKEDLGNAIALNSSMVNAARLVGPSIAGIIIAGLNEGICFLINTISYFFVIISLAMMIVPSSKIKSKKIGVLEGLKGGISYTFGFAPIRSIIMLLSLISLTGMSYAVLMPVFAKEILNGDSHTFGFLMGASGSGALIGAIYMAFRKSVLGLDKIIPLSAALFGGGLIVFSLSRNFILSSIIMLLTGFAMIMQLTSSNTILQTIVDDDKRGRVMSFYTMAFVGTAPFGSLLAGGLANKIGAPDALIIGGISCIIGAAIFIGKLSGLKKMVHPIYVKLGIIPEVAAGIQTATELTVPPEK
jgi:MFS family permease